MEQLLKILADLQVDTKLILVAVIFMGLDILTGCIRAFVNKEFKSSIFRKGLAKKAGEICLILVGYLLDYACNTTVVGPACLWMIIGGEGYSIVIENLSEIVPVPEILKSLLENLKGGEHKEETDNGERF